LRVKYTEFVPNPALRNTVTHLPPHIAQNLIAQGVAVHVPYKNYVEFLSEEHREGSSSFNVNPPQVVGVVWECCAAARSGTPTIFRRQGGETARMTDEAQAIQYGCPESTLKMYRALLAEKNGGVNVAEVAKAEQAKQVAEEKTATWKTIWSRA
jgi:hypothetical protein